MSDSQVVTLESGSATVVSEGPPSAPRVVVVPPLGMPAAVLAPFVRALCPRLRVCVVELPGAGEASDAAMTISTRGLARSLATVVSSLGSGKSHVFGVSLGGMVAQWLAIDAGDTIARLVLASTAARGRDVVLSEPLEKLAIAARAIGAGPPRAAIAEAVVSEALREDPVETRRIAREIESAPRPAHELLWLAGAAARHDASQHLSSIRAPTLVLTGVNDDLIAPRLQDELARGIAGAERAYVADAGHSVTLDQPIETARIVEEFLSRPAGALSRAALPAPIEKAR